MPNAAELANFIKMALLGFALVTPSAAAQEVWGVSVCQRYTIQSLGLMNSIIDDYKYPNNVTPISCAGFNQSPTNIYIDSGTIDVEHPGEIILEGRAEMGTLNVMMSGNVVRNGSQGAAFGLQSLQWTDALSMISQNLPTGSPATFDVAVSYSGKIESGPLGISHVYLQVVLPTNPSVGLQPLNISNPGIDLSSLNGSGISKAKLHAHVGDNFQFGRLVAQVYSADGQAIIDAADAKGSSGFIFKVTIDTENPCVSYTTSSSMSYLSQPVQCSPPQKARFSFLWVRERARRKSRRRCGSWSVEDEG